MNTGGGCEWVVEAHGCDAAALRETGALRELFDEMVRELHLTPLAEQSWHKFPGEGGVTGIVMLTESHLACHTFPEYRSLCLNLFCCRPRPEWDFEGRLRQRFGATNVQVRRIDRPYSA